MVMSKHDVTTGIERAGATASPVYDPRARRLNPQIDEFVGILNDHWDSLLSETDYLERKGRLRVIRQIIDQIIEQPEWLEADLQAGAARDVDCWLGAGEVEPVACLDQRPFDLPAGGAGHHFFHTSAGRVSALFQGPPVDPGTIPGLQFMGVYIYCLEPCHLVAVETRNRVICDNLWHQLLPDYFQQIPPFRDGPRYFVLCDPRGVGGGGQALRVAVLTDENEAIELAESLAASLQIRFLVAREHYRFCTR